MSDEVFTSRDISVRFQDGQRTGEKSQFSIDFENADLNFDRNRELVPMKSRGQVKGLRLGNGELPQITMGWQYASKDPYENVANFLTGVVPSARVNENLCPAPNDYNDPWWTKSGLVTPIGDNGVAPDGQSIAQRLVPNPSPGVGYIQGTAYYTPLDPKEKIFIDFWVKATTAHTSFCQVAVSHHGMGIPPPAFGMDLDVKTYWQKITTGHQLDSDYITQESVTITINQTKFSSAYSMDLWGVEIRQDITVEPLTWDMYIDVYKNGVLDETVIFEDVMFENIRYSEDSDGSDWSMILRSRKGNFKVV